ncbi:hypothetical protein NDN08_001949 [Rhodosorus marinus]|uniref:Protein CASP n=1 Tax=Rhodosorus marinus TaxID=101924 RepID=A0AAV8UWP2_9RHOD|nr:hypothetical protein NDN08_001949 [Rhodosorus marinus]
MSEGEGSLETPGGSDGGDSPQKQLIDKIRAHESYAAKIKSAYADLSKMYNQLREDYATFVNKHNEVTKELEHSRQEQQERIAELEEIVGGEDLAAIKKDLERVNAINLDLMKQVEETDELREELEEVNVEKQTLIDQNQNQEKDLILVKEELDKLRQQMEILVNEETTEETIEVDENVDADEVDILETLQRIDDMRLELRDRLSGGTSQNDSLEKDKEAGKLDASSFPSEDAEALLHELVKVKTDLAESETARLRLQQEISRLRKLMILEILFMCRIQEECCRPAVAVTVDREAESHMARCDNPPFANATHGFHPEVGVEFGCTCSKTENLPLSSAPRAHVRKQGREGMVTSGDPT